MVRPTVATITEELYAGLGPLAAPDPHNDWTLLKLIASVTDPLQEVEDLARDDDTGRSGWSYVVDGDDVPLAWIDWLGQFVGVVPDDNLNEADRRARLAAKDGFGRGTRAAIVAAAQAHLTGAKVVDVHERDGGNPYALRIETYAADTPKASLVRAALKAATPGGILLTYNIADPESYDDVAADFATYDDLTAGLDTYDDMISYTL